MAALEPSWILKKRIAELDVSEELRTEIDRFIKNHDAECTGKKQSIMNIMYRQNLHAIIDSFNQLDTVIKLRELNDKADEVRRLSP